MSMLVQEGGIKLLDVVALVVDKPADGLRAGQVGTVVEVFTPDDFEVEFLALDGRTDVLAELKRGDLRLVEPERVDG